PPSTRTSSCTGRDSFDCDSPSEPLGERPDQRLGKEVGTILRALRAHVPERWVRLLRSRRLRKREPLKIRAVPLVVAVSLFAALGMNGGAAVARPVDRSRGAGVVDHYPDFVKYGYLVGDRARFDRLKAEAIRRAATRHPSAAHPSAAHPSTVAAPVANPSFQGAYDNAGAPPDTTGAIGPQSFVEAVNSRIDVYSRTGTHLGGNTFTDALGPCESGVSGGLCEYSDPQVLYDLGTNRFYYEDLNADLSGNRNVFKFGFSKSSAPTTFDQTQWCNYTIDFGYGTSIPDYPKMAVTADFAVIG